MLFALTSLTNLHRSLIYVFAFWVQGLVLFAFIFSLFFFLWEYYILVKTFFLFTPFLEHA